MSRSLKKGPFVDFKLAKKVAALTADDRTIIKTWARASTISPEMVGRTIAQFVSRECKPEDWTPAPPTNIKLFAHEQAQRKWAALVVLAGGDATFATGAT